MWKSLLFINNLTDGVNMCMTWGWYLQNDMQLFTYSIFILLVYNRSKFASYMMIILSILCSFGYFFLITQVKGYHSVNHFSDLQYQKYYMDLLYTKPWSRCPPYLYGLLLGMLYSQFLEGEKNEES